MGSQSSRSIAPINLALDSHTRPFVGALEVQNHAIGWLQRGYSSLGGGTTVRFPRIWGLSGKCRLTRNHALVLGRPKREACTALRPDLVVDVLCAANLGAPRVEPWFSFYARAQLSLPCRRVLYSRRMTLCTTCEARVLLSARMTSCGLPVY